WHLKVITAATGESRSVHEKEHGLVIAAITGQTFAVKIEGNAILAGPMVLRLDAAGRRRRSGHSSSGRSKGGRCRGLHEMAAAKGRWLASVCHGRPPFIAAIPAVRGRGGWPQAQVLRAPLPQLDPDPASTQIGTPRGRPVTERMLTAVGAG